MIKFFFGSDNIFLILSFSVIVAGILILASASLNLSAERFGSPYYYLSHQFLFGILPGLVLLIVCYKIPYKFWKNWSVALMIISCALMALVLIPQISLLHGGARRWLSLGPISFQPSEFLKFAFVAYLASWLESRGKNIGSFKFGLLPFIIMSGFVASFLIFQPDIGTLLVILSAVFFMFFASGGNWKQMGVLILVAIASLAILVALEPYRRDRIAVFLNPQSDVQGKGYQLNQALIAIGSGGIFGKGFGFSYQKFGNLPEILGDSIFAILAEELGFLGSMAVLLLFLFIFLRGVYIINRIRDRFGQLLGMGILFTVVFQALINIAAIVGLIPLTGIPLSFISYGSSALVIMMAEIGIFLNISKHAK
ncbi:MAG: putative lipid II flippase FtsW [Patescibacteria group bacterium]